VYFRVGLAGRVLKCCNGKQYLDDTADRGFIETFALDGEYSWAFVRTDTVRTVYGM